jgi:glycerate dehydrogenase
MTQIVFLDRGTIGPAISLTKPNFSHEWVDYNQTRPDQVVKHSKGADIVVSNKVPIRRVDIEQLPGLKMICIPATGYDAFDIDACQERGIVVSNVRGYAINTVPEHVLSLILALRRSLVGYRQDVIDGKWQEANQFCFFNHPISDLAGSTIGIIGRGALGQGVARLAQAFGMNTLFAAHKDAFEFDPEYASFDNVLETSDVISLHCPLMASTHNLIARPEFEKMKRRPLLINCARGGLVNEGDLVDALNQGVISGLGFDCLTTEPPKTDNPLLSVLGRPNVIVTPHTAWASDEAMQTLWAQVVSNIENFQAEYPSNQVT